MRKLFDSIRFPFQSKVWRWFIQSSERFEFVQLFYGEERYVLRDRFGRPCYLAKVNNGYCRIYNLLEDCLLSECQGKSFSKEMADRLFVNL